MSKLPPHLELGLNELDNAEALGDLEAEKRGHKMLAAAGLDPDEVGEHRAARAASDDEAELELEEEVEEEGEEVQQTRAEAKAAAAERAAAKAQDEAPTGRAAKADKMSTADAPAGEKG